MTTETIAETASATTVVLTPAQTAALDALTAFAQGESDFQVMALEGYAGTGKTTLVGELVRLLGPSMPIAIAAPTNKAVGVLREKVGEDNPVTFGTIHHFLGLQLREREDGSREVRQEGEASLHTFHLAIIDECSMIDSKLFNHILVAMRGCRVIFVGDPAQLPPIDAGKHANPLDQLSPTFARVRHKATLTEVVRQAAGNPIIASSMVIRQRIEEGQATQPADLAANEDGERLVIAYGGGSTVYNWAVGAIQNGIDARIVAYRNVTVDAYNQAIHAAVCIDYRRQKGLDPTSGDACPFSIGERVMVHESWQEARATPDPAAFTKSKRTTLHTSEEALVVDIVPTRHPFHPLIPTVAVVLERETGETVVGFVPSRPGDLKQAIESAWAQWRSLKAEEESKRALREYLGDLPDRRKEASQKAGSLSRAFAPLRHVYAITAHKSQGSTIDTVIVDFADLSRMRDPFDFNRALYVAVTRAARHVAVVI